MPFVSCMFFLFSPYVTSQQAIELDMANTSGQLHVHYSNRSAAYLKQVNVTCANESDFSC